MEKIPTPENVESEIEHLLEELDGFADIYDRVSPETQEEWWEVEMGGKVALDRAVAKATLERFLGKLKEIKAGL